MLSNSIWIEYILNLFFFLSAWVSRVWIQKWSPCSCCCHGLSRLRIQLSEQWYTRIRYQPPGKSKAWYITAENFWKRQSTSWGEKQLFLYNSLKEYIFVLFFRKKYWSCSELLVEYSACSPLYLDGSLAISRQTFNLSVIFNMPHAMFIPGCWRLHCNCWEMHMLFLIKTILI